MRQPIRITIDLDVDHELARALPELPGLGGPDGHPPISGLDLVTEDLRQDLLRTILKEISTPGSDLSRLGAITLGATVRYGKPQAPTHEPF
jgi:hypothetical protein